MKNLLSKSLERLNVLAEYEDHFEQWLERSVHRSEQEGVRTAIRELLLNYPTLIDEGKSWPEMRRMAEED
jgi:hypothetical protein